MITKTEDVANFLQSDERLTIEALLAARLEMATNGRLRQSFFEDLRDLDRLADKDGVTPDERLKLGAAWWVLGEPDRAIEVLGHSLFTPVALYVTGWVHLQRREFTDAVDRFEKALAKDPKSFAFQIMLAEALRKLGRTEEAQQILKSLQKKHDGEPDLHYELGVLLTQEGLKDEATAEYERALDLDPAHGKALFRLASILDQNGEDEEALEFYKRCCELQPTFVNALINLGILYEDMGKYDEAIECYRKVLKVFPAHDRARMFLKDAKASQNMYYDEDQIRERDKREQVLRTPVSDFELSVRSRNCLEKMNIRTLGDLIDKDEAELLSYKNFGETSLVEIKELLTARGLRLGQNKPVDDEDAAARLNEALRDRSDQLLEEPISTLGLNIRSERCMMMLEIRTVGELVAMSEPELLLAKSFGETSLIEVKEALAQRGLTLRSV